LNPNAHVLLTAILPLYATATLSLYATATLCHCHSHRAAQPAPGGRPVRVYIYRQLFFFAFFCFFFFHSQKAHFFFTSKWHKNGTKMLKIAPFFFIFAFCFCRYAGVNVRRACISDMREENVLQPLLVSVSAMKLAVQTVRHILRVDDLLQVM
jgi:hypothetical protein